MEGWIFAIIAFAWLFSILLGPNDGPMWVLRIFLTVAFVLAFLELTGLIDLIRTGGPVLP